MRAAHAAARWLSHSSPRCACAQLSVSVEGKADEQSPLREMELVFSPCSPRARCFYVVQSDAVRGVRLEG